MAFIEQQRPSKLPSVAAVAIVHVAIGYAFLSGLACRVVSQGPMVLQLMNVPDSPPPPPPPPPTEPLKKATPATRAITTTTPVSPVPDDSFRPIPLPPQPDTFVDLTVGNSVEPVPPPPSPVERATTPPRARGARAGWITADDYPSNALRAGEQGTVSLSIRVGTDGRVTGCIVTGSSGSATLDQATCRLYPRRARFTPATDGTGAAIAATMTDRVMWRVPN